MIKEPKQIKKIYDNERKTIDRYTVITTHRYSFGEYLGFTMNKPTHPQGFCQSIAIKPKNIGNHLGKEIKWEKLPQGCKEFLEKEFRYYDMLGEEFYDIEDGVDVEVFNTQGDYAEVKEIKSGELKTVCVDRLE